MLQLRNGKYLQKDNVDVSFMLVLSCPVLSCLVSNALPAREVKKTQDPEENWNTRFTFRRRGDSFVHLRLGGGHFPLKMKGAKIRG
jgi:hypothetical protein